MLGNFQVLKVQAPSSDAEISWIACRHIPHPLILVAFVSVISYFQLPACSADPNEPRSRGRSVSQVNALSSSLAVISLSNLEMGRKGENFLSAVGKLFFSGFISLACSLAGISFKQITLLNPPKRRPPPLHPPPAPARPCGCYQDTFTASMPKIAGCDVGGAAPSVSSVISGGRFPLGVESH